MSILDKLFGHEEHPKQQVPQPQQPYPNQPQQAAPPQQTAQTADQQAIARYQYMLKTAPPETIEQAHQEAFAQLSPEQRRQVLQQLTSTMPASERPPANAADDPQALARAATRAEVRQPGTLERLFGSSSAAPGGGGGGMGIGGSLLTGLAGAFVGTAIADHFFRGPMGGGFMGSGLGGFGGGGYGGGTVINETVNNYGSDSDNNDDSSDNSSDDSSDNSDDSSTDDSSSFDDSADYSDAGGDNSGGGVDV